MKLYFITLISLVFFSLSLFSCTTDNSDDDLNNINTTEEEVVAEDEGETTSPESEEMMNEGMTEKEEEQEEAEESTDVEADNVLATGTLQTNSSYPTAGNFTFTTTNDQVSLDLDHTFSVEGGLPDLVIYLSNVTDSQENAFLISDTAADSGMQSIEIPNEVDFLEYKYVLLYCRKYNQKVGFGEIIDSMENN